MFSKAAMADRRTVISAGIATAAGVLAGGAPAMADEVSAAPKYIFLFIGDGMGAEQVQVASIFQGTVESGGEVVASPLSFMEFPHVGSVTTYDSTSFCSDSASTATSIATGFKTYW